MTNPHARSINLYAQVSKMLDAQLEEVRASRTVHHLLREAASSEWHRRQDESDAKRASREREIVAERAFEREVVAMADDDLFRLADASDGWSRQGSDIAGAGIASWEAERIVRREAGRRPGTSSIVARRGRRGDRLSRRSRRRSRS